MFAHLSCFDTPPCCHREGAVATGPDQPEPAHSNGEGDGALEGKPGDVANGDDSKASSSSGMVEKPADDKPRHVPLWMGCRSVEVYERLATINEGTFVSTLFCGSQCNPCVVWNLTL